MASNRLRALRNVGTRLNYLQLQTALLQRRPSPRKLAQNLIDTGNLRRYMATEPLIAPDAITNEKIETGAVDTEELADSAVTEEKLDIDAVTGKNITSCMITDSDIENCRFSSIQGSDLTVDSNLVVTSGFDLTSGTIAQVDITGPSTFTGDDVVFDGVKLSNVTADVITGEGSLTLAGGSVTVDGGSGAIVNGGGGSMAVTGSFFSVSSGGGFNVTTSSAEVGVNWQSFTLNGEPLMPLEKFMTEIEKINQKSAQAMAAIPSCGCL